MVSAEFNRNLIIIRLLGAGLRLARSEINAGPVTIACHSALLQMARDIPMTTEQEDLVYQAGQIMSLHDDWALRTLGCFTRLLVHPSYIPHDIQTAAEFVSTLNLHYLPA